MAENNNSLVSLYGNSRNKRDSAKRIDFSKYTEEELIEDAINAPVKRMYKSSGVIHQGGQRYRWSPLKGGRYAASKNKKKINYNTFMVRPLTNAWSFGMWHWLDFKHPVETIAYLSTKNPKDLASLDVYKIQKMREDSENELLEV